LVTAWIVCHAADSLAPRIVLNGAEHVSDKIGLLAPELLLPPPPLLLLLPPLLLLLLYLNSGCKTFCQQMG
jgi:hypothetical protein